MGQTDPLAIAALQEDGHTAIAADMRDYCPAQPHDLVILLNAPIEERLASAHLVHDGYLLANDYLGNATALNAKPEEFTLFGSMSFAEPDRRRGDHRVIISLDQRGLFEPWENLAALRDAQPKRHQELIDEVHGFFFTARRELRASEEENYRTMQQLLGESETLPYKRSADFYIFQKR